MITIKHTNELTPQELVTIFKERVAVFVVEQNCPYQEVDEVDYDTLHVCAYEENQLVAYTRILEKGERISFGRVLVTEAGRGKGLGKEIVKATIDEIKKRYPNRDIEISGQTYLLDFYQNFGFEVISETYLEDDIPHNDMLLKLS